MVVMNGHEWKDPDIERVLFTGNENNRILYFKENADAIIVNKQDVIALAKEFNLIVFEKGSKL